MTEEPILNRDIALSLLRLPLGCVFVTEYLRHSWSNTFSKPFLRIWDYYSGSQPDNESRMKSRAPRQLLDTWESRKNSLAIHINPKIWKPTPYITFTTSPAAAQEIADLRASRRGSDPYNGLPILDLCAEMDHYGVEDPDGKSNQYYIDHYLCLWKVTGREIVGHWEWTDLVTNERWYPEIILHCIQRAHDIPTCERRDFKLVGRHESALFDSHTSSEGVTCYFDDGLESDTDDEVEEVNASDDIIKIIEGD
ncbi:hypothetical protein F5884DRAFT_905854 [Xylogone sp. PMI_703]|nr:hypothetical protein F5884DRAFT_905854 [Xylogone sp. PMI_703]